ncbi:6964_t:CDS:2, partial [Scutellospora calospora]
MQRSIHSIQHYDISSYNNVSSSDSNNDTIDTIFNSYTYHNEINQNITIVQPNNLITTSHYNQLNIAPLPFLFWRPSQQLLKLYAEFQNKILQDHLHILSFKIPVYLREFKDERPTKVAICSSCKPPKTRRFPPILAPTPSE